VSETSEVQCPSCKSANVEFWSERNIWWCYSCRTGFGDGPEGALDICGLCGFPGADKVPHPIHWPGENSPGTEYVHATCEDEECRRAHAMLTERQREAFLRTV
jgi:hypothetical protein